MYRTTRPPERKQVSVLFADLCESTAQVAAGDPEEAQILLDRALHLMSEAVEAYGGTVSQLLGDGLLALFGAPLAQEDHALRACLAAITIQQRARAARGVVEPSAQPMVVRIGIHSGEVLVTSARAGLSAHCRVHGTAIHLASRLEHLARAGSVLISGTTFRLVEGQIEATALGAHEIRGLSGKVELFELALAGQLSAVLPRAPRHRSGPLLARAQTMADLHSIARQVVAGEMRVIGLRGEAGIGKSRIIAELSEQLRAQGFTVCTIAAHSYASHISCGVVARLMRELMRVPSELQPGRQHEVALMTIGCGETGPDLPAADLLGFGVPGEMSLSLPPSQRLQRIGDALHWLIGQRSAAGPLMIVIEDICLADRDSRRVLESLARRLEGMKVLICASYRPDFAHRWAGTPWFSEHSIGPLPKAEMTRLARDMLGEHGSLDMLIAALVEKADGNPFFCEQMAMTLVHDAMLTGVPSARRFTSLDADLRVPGSIAAVIGARVDRLPRAAKASLEAAAVLGQPFSDRLIASMQGLATKDVDGHLMLAVSAGLLSEPERGQPAPHAFRHAVVQEVVAGALTRPRRELLHRAALIAMGMSRSDHLAVAYEVAPRAGRIVEHHDSLHDGPPALGSAGAAI